MMTKQLDRETIFKIGNPMGPENRCKDYDGDCEAIKTGALHCWLHDPEQGWCPYLKGGDKCS